jgi:2-hydroxy-3-keto-5-methylthiopentenyl-1-phosphate phosphatase
VLRQFVRDSRVALRSVWKFANHYRKCDPVCSDDADALIAHCESREIPLIVFSAGVGDMITLFLTQQLGRVPDNIHLISNMMTYNDQV